MTIDSGGVVRFGRPTPWRGIIASAGIGVGFTLSGMVLSLLSPHPEAAPALLVFLLLPALAIPLLLFFNQYAVFDPRTGLISINGAAPLPLSHITRARASVHRGISTLDLGVGPSRSQRFKVANGPFGSPQVERDWVRHLLPYTGLPRTGLAPDEYDTRHANPASFEEASVFAHRWLR